MSNLFYTSSNQHLNEGEILSRLYPIYSSLQSKLVVGSKTHTMNKFLNHMRLQAQLVQGIVATTRLGIISGYDPNNYCAKVLLQPDGAETGWLPIFSSWIGNGWGLFCPPNIGDMCEVHFQEGSYEVGIIGLRGYNDTDRPLSVPAGEWWLVHQNGSCLKFTNDGKVTINGNTEIGVTAPTVKIITTGDCAIQANNAAITASQISLGAEGQTLKGLLQETAVAIYNSHTHNDPQGGITDIPNQPMSTDMVTSTVRGG